MKRATAMVLSVCASSCGATPVAEAPSVVVTIDPIRGVTAPREKGAADRLESLTIRSTRDVMALNGGSYTNRNFADGRFIMAGADESNWTWRCFLYFPLDSVPAGVRIEEASLRLTPDEKYEGTVEKTQFCVHAIVESWSEKEVKWYDQPEIEPTVASRHTVYRDRLSIDMFDITKLVREWVEDGADNYGLSVRSCDEKLDIRKGWISSGNEKKDGPTLRVLLSSGE